MICRNASGCWENANNEHTIKTISVTVSFGIAGLPSLLNRNPSSLAIQPTVRQGFCKAAPVSDRNFFVATKEGGPSLPWCFDSNGNYRVPPANRNPS
jgi:hypothetical protein